MSADESWPVPREHDGWRIDRALATRPSVGSRSRAREVVESGKVSVGTEAVIDPSRTVRADEVVVVAWNRPGTGRAQRLARATVAEAGLAILHEDPWTLAVDKPPGLLTDAATREQRMARDTAVHRLRRYLRPQGKIALPAHRIDRDTSGIVLFAKDEATHEALRAQFHAHHPERVYLAVLQGRPSDTAGTWSDWMAWDDRALIQRAVRPDAPGAFHAQAHWRLVEALPDGLSVVEVRLVSGRRNQIRLHAWLRGMPLLGERMYVDPGRDRRRPPLERHALHAWRLAFDHPVTRDRIRLESPVPHDLARWIRTLPEPR